jgi:hypothetical protein
MHYYQSIWQIVLWVGTEMTSNRETELYCLIQGWDAGFLELRMVTLCSARDNYCCCFQQACWTLHNFSEVTFKQEPILIEAIRLTTTCLLQDQELPVKVEAAVALQMIISNQEPSHKFIEPQVKYLS